MCSYAVMFFIFLAYFTLYNTFNEFLISVIVLIGMYLPISTSVCNYRSRMDPLFNFIDPDIGVIFTYCVHHIF